MIPLSLPATGSEPVRLLVLGAHSDDIEIGCGATLLELLADERPVAVHWVVFSGDGERRREAEQSAASFLESAADRCVEVLGFRDGFFPYQGAQVKEEFERLKRAIAPDIVFTHRGADRHQDHRLLAELTWNTFRDHVVLEYEIPKYDGDLGQPNVFVPVNEATRMRKIDLLMKHFGTQRSKAWFTPSTFDGLLRLRGVECASPTGYAEGFHARKLVLAPFASKGRAVHA